ncbi:ABC transporter ATP-binding protein/permease [Apilactobacillus sp. TMW 2.2459]|uniref:ATP-binding cassette domain-containing protein n=1 Tax=Apilactobacillus xinyiensis TaxID=2841032 RepID=UPI00200CAA98|nr:ABC transporter ATP-binding protein [Apilactobacillus xinyiensis]MCL0312151.1 ABC transporter ATP-binding protein/permease [Apilactobacillus xinyiensis]
MFNKKYNYFITYFLNHNLSIIKIVLSAFILTMLKILLSFSMGNFIDFAVNKEVTRVLIAGILSCLALILIYFVSIYMDSKNLEIVKSIQLELKRNVYISIFYSDNRKLNNFDSSNMSNIVINTIPTIGKDYFLNYLNCINQAIQILLCSLSLIFININIFILFFIVSAIPFLLNPLVKKRFGKYKEALNKNLKAHTSMLYNFINGINTIKAYAVTDVFFKMLSDKDSSLEHQRKFSNLWDLRIVEITRLLSMSSQIICMIIAALFIVNGYITVGSLTITMQLLNYIIPSINSINSNHLVTSATYALRVEYFNSVKLSSEPSGKKYINGDIKISSLTFNYNNNKPIFVNFNGAFKQNSTNVVIGASGSGKSTLMKIISGEISGYKGLITFNDVNINDISQQSFYSNVVYVNQTPVIFDGTVEDNVTLFSNVNKKRLDEILKNLNLLEMKHRWISNDKNNLSGGEKQRISLARALLIEPSVLIIDEPNSGQDPVLSKKIDDIIFNIKNKTVFVVNHNWDAKYLNRFDNIIELT